MSTPVVYLNGQIVPAAEARLAIYDAGVVLGATVAEQTRTFHHRPFRLADHLDRLFRSLAYASIEIEPTWHDLAAVSYELVRHNAAFLPPGGELGLIHFVTAGEIEAYSWGEIETSDSNPKSKIQNPKSKPTVCVHTYPLDWRRWARSMRDGAHLVIPSVRQVPSQSVDAKVKCRSRMHYYLADQEARRIDPDASALLLDLDGNVTETSSANFLIVEQGAILSPTTNNILPGISRQTVIDLAGQLGIPFIERDLQPYQAMNADEAFLTSTPYCLLPVTKLNGLTIGGGKPGPIFRRLLDGWNQLVGLDIERQILDGAAAFTLKARKT